MLTSSDSASAPNRRDELFYLGPDNRIMVVPYRINGTTFESSTPQVWADQTLLRRPVSRSIDLHPDGERFAVSVPETFGVDRTHVVLVSNFFDELRRKFSVR